MLGPARGAEVYAATLQRCGLKSLDTPDDRLRFGEALMQRGGLFAAIGRSIKIQAILQGATEPG